jgi:predicted nucleic acid-binding protein
VPRKAESKRIISPDTPSAVFDCNIFLQALIAEAGPAAACIALVDASRVTLILSPETLAEAVDVLSRAHLRRKFRTLTEERVREFLHHTLAVSVIVAEVPRLVNLERDPMDSRHDFTV